MSEPTTEQTQAVPETVPLSSSGDGKTDPATPGDAKGADEAAARQALPIPGMPLNAPVPAADEED